jgi:hypothetical protein
MTISTAVSTSPNTDIDEFDVDSLPTSGNPQEVCPRLAAYYEYRLVNDCDPDMTFDLWVETQAKIADQIDQAWMAHNIQQSLEVADQIDQVWMERKAHQLAELEDVLLEGYIAAFSYFVEVTPTMRHLSPASATAVSETATTHKVSVLPQASLGTTASPVPVFRSFRQARTKKSAYLPKVQKRPLDMYEKRQLRSGTIPAVLALTPHLVKLELREHIWHAVAKAQRSTARHNLARMRSTLGMSA